LSSGQWCSKIALPFRRAACRVVYAVQIAQEIWVIHVFQQKSTPGVKTPQREIKYRLRAGGEYADGSTA
jgi:phage-related protein